ncbi:hypothetical protein AMECASPLE_006443 [Ameca splendens]|uniref:Uncharacterized protein n=1 Tax=Ameca splendens TaxID=208324 RepID=A0ABV0ZJ57_9TELE
MEHLQESKFDISTWMKRHHLPIILSKSDRLVISADRSPKNITSSIKVFVQAVVISQLYICNDLSAVLPAYTWKLTFIGSPWLTESIQVPHAVHRQTSEPAAVFPSGTSSVPLSQCGTQSQSRLVSLVVE